MKPTFVLCKDWINYTNEMSNEDRWILLNAIMQYQNWLDPWDLPYAVKIVFAHIKNFFIEQDKKYEEIKEKRSESGKKWGRPTAEKAKKANAFSEKQTKAKQNKQKLTETDTDTNNSHSKEWENNPNGLLPLLNNCIYYLKYNTSTWHFEKIETSDVLYWKQTLDVTQALLMIKENNHWVIDWSEWDARKDAKNLIKKIEKMESVASWKNSRDQVLATILALMKDDKYFWPKLSSPKKIYDHFGELVAQVRLKFQEKTNSKKNIRSFSSWQSQ